MKQKFFFPEKIGRTSWLVRLTLAMLFGIAAMMMVESIFFRVLELQGRLLCEIFTWSIAIVTAAYSLFYIHLARVRHIGMPAPYVLAILVPIINLLFCLLLLVYGEDSWEAIKERHNLR